MSSLRRFFLHVLPRGFVRIRHFGFFAHRRRAALLPLCFALLGQTGDSQTVTDSTPADAPRPLWLCPQCGGTMAIVERFTASEARLRAPPSGKRTTMTCSLSSRIYPARGRQPVRTARILCRPTATPRGILPRRLLSPGCVSLSPASSAPATNNTIQNA